MIFNREPVAILAAVRALVLAVMAFGANVSAEQLAAVMLALEALLAVVTRAKVTPVDSGGGDAGQSLVWTVVGLLAAAVLIVWLVGAVDVHPR